MARNSDKLRELVLKYLKDTPNVSVACKKAGLPRSTYYRWCSEDVYFAGQCEDALMEGVEHMSDMAESALWKLVQSGQYYAIKYWLDNHRYPYRKGYEQQKRRWFFDWIR